MFNTRWLSTMELFQVESVGIVMSYYRSLRLSSLFYITVLLMVVVRGVDFGVVVLGQKEVSASFTQFFSDLH